MKKSITIAAYTIVLLLLFKFAFTYGYNEWVISKYEDGDYSENFSLLEVFNFTEPYIVYYNNGNVMYQKMDYEAAIEYYEQALDENPPEGKECPIRINLALAKLKLLGEDYLTPEKIEDTIDLLEECLDILSEEDCANEDDDGHDNRAQRLYNEIKEMLDQAQQEQEQQQQEQQQQQQQQQQEQQKNQEEQQDQQQQQQQQQQDQQQQEQKEPPMSKENAEQLLNAAMQEEKKTQEKMQQMQQGQRRQIEKNW